MLTFPEATSPAGHVTRNIRDKMARIDRRYNHLELLVFSRHATERFAALKLLETLPRESEDNPFVIAGKNDLSHLINLQKPWNRVRAHAKLDDVRIHDLRHSFAGTAASAGVPLQIVGGLLGHSSPQTTARYAHLWLDPLAKATETIGTIIKEVSR